MYFWVWKYFLWLEEILFYLNLRVFGNWWRFKEWYVVVYFYVCYLDEGVYFCILIRFVVWLVMWKLKRVVGGVRNISYLEVDVKSNCSYLEVVVIGFFVWKIVSIYEGEEYRKEYLGWRGRKRNCFAWV